MEKSGLYNGTTHKITLIYTFFGQFERIAGIRKEKHPDCKVIIIDDCYKKPLKKIKCADVYRIKDDITWNQPGAKNLGFQEAEGWVVCADIDHLVTKKNIDEIIKLKKEQCNIYYLGREDNDSWNVFLIHKDDFEKVGGFDEDFSGDYGYDDIDFLERCRKNLNIIEKREIKVKVYADKSSSKLERNCYRNFAILRLKINNKINTGKRIRFNWKKL